MHFDGQDCLVGFFRDVSERKQLQEERDRILNMSQDFICIAGMDGYFKFVNPAGERLLGYSREELLARPLLDFIYPEDHSKNDAALERLSSDNILSDFENRYVCKDGSIRNFSWTAAALSEKGLIYCVGRDITERKRAEQVVITTKEFLESVYNTIPDVLVVTDGKGYITNINKAVDKLLGFCQKEMVGKHISELFPKDEKYDQIRTQMMSKLRKKGEIKSLEANWIKKDGILCSVELNIAMLQDNDGNNMGGLAVVRDITERKRHAEQLQEREERFRTIAETSNDAIIAADSRGKVLYWNKAAETMYEYTKSEILGKSIELLRPEGKRLTDRKNRNEFIKTGQSPYVGKTVEGMARKKDGTEFPCETSTSFWTMGDQIIFCGIVRDITERKEMEAQIKKSHRELEKKVKQRTAELKKSNDQLQISQEYLKKFAGMLLSAREEERKNISTVMHDELGSMAIAVDSQISIAKEECNENNKQATFTALTNAQTALRKAVGDLRRLAVDLRPPNLDIMGLPAALTDLIDKAKENTKLKIIFRNETGDKKIPGETAIVIYRIIQEGLTNVIKHAKAQSIRVRLYADTKNINLDIADDGIGCTLKKVLYGKRKPSIGILGMRERVESLGGEFTITSAPQKGTQLKVALPKN
jgi:PAS domain S-box-containing protein